MARSLVVAPVRWSRRPARRSAGTTRAVEPQLLLIAVDVLHVLTGGVWLGGLVGLALALGSARVCGTPRRSASSPGSRPWPPPGVAGDPRTILAWRIVGTGRHCSAPGTAACCWPRSHWAQVAVALAGWNRFVLLPSALPERSRPVRLRLAGVADRRSVVAAEAAVLALVVGVTGFLVDQSPRPGAGVGGTSPTGVGRAQLGDLVVLAELVPARVGRSRLHVQLQDAAANPAEPAHPPEVRLRSDLVDLGGGRVSPGGRRCTPDGARGAARPGRLAGA
ncbi:MAG: hypothetical protein R2719_12310 [Micropruina sp.]